jgi:hypothetical protein
VLGRVTDNMLRAFAAGSAGRAHPARDYLMKIKMTQRVRAENLIHVMRPGYIRG